MKESEFPTTSSALAQLKEGDYDILQLSKKVDEIIKALPTGVESEVESTEGSKGKAKEKSARESSTFGIHMLPHFADHDKQVKPLRLSQR